MTFQFKERPNSRAATTNPPGVVLRYVANGYDDPAYVKSYAIAATSPYYVSDGILFRQDVKLESIGGGIFYIEVPYGPQESTKPPVGSMRWGFDTTGGTIKIFNSKSTVASYGEAPVPDHKGAINVSVSKGDVEGVDIIVPALKLNITYKHPLGVITLPQIRALAGFTGCVNSDTFLGFAAGEVLFLGATGGGGTDSETEVAYQFACQQNVTGQSIGDISGIAKDGHDYLWISYKDAVDEDNPVKQAKFVYVERVYTRIAFASLGIT